MKYETYETVYGETIIKSTDDNGQVWTFGEIAGNADYEKYVADTQKTLEPKK